MSDKTARNCAGNAPEDITMKKLITGVYLMATVLASAADQMIFRIAEIEVYPQNLEDYVVAAKTVGAESVANEPGVVCLFPMQKKEHPTQIRIVEIYRDEAARTIG